MDSHKSFLLVDVSYTTFYKFYALKNWYMLAHKDIASSNIELTTIPEFVEKYKKLYIEQIYKVAKKYDVPKSNIIYALDCPSKDIWRRSLYPEYKGTRKASHERQGFQPSDCNIFSITRDIIAQNAHPTAILSHPQAEADDVIAVVRENLMLKVSSDSVIYIMASDADYQQICGMNTIQLNMKGDILTDVCKVGSTALLTKILVGDVSDNIPPCHILPNHPILKNQKIMKITKTNVHKVIEIKEFVDLMNSLDLRDADYTQNNQFTLNKCLMDFKMIPEDIRNNILEYMYICNEKNSD